MRASYTTVTFKIDNNNIDASLEAILKLTTALTEKTVLEFLDSLGISHDKWREFKGKVTA